MLTLNQTAGDNNETIWVLRLRGEGANFVTLGDFSASTGWTMTGDWTIGSGVADYTYVDDTAGVLYRTVAAVAAVSYILDYEVISRAGTNFTAGTATLETSCGGSYVFAGTDPVLLDSTVGKHSINLLGLAGGTILRFVVDGTAATDQLSIDNVSLRLADNTLYLSTKDFSVADPSENVVTFDGQLLNYDNYLTDLNQNSSIAGSGGTGSVSSFSLSISRYVNNAGFSSFFNNFYPTTNAGYLTGKIIDFGICWTGATLDTEITWLFRGRIIDYSYEQRQLNLTIFQESEISNKEVPYYTVQKDFNNGLSYYANAPFEAYGATIPIVYGDFTIGTADDDGRRYTGYTALSPCIPVFGRYTTYLMASHKVYKEAEDLLAVDCIFKYISSVQSYLRIRNETEAGSTGYNTNIKHYINLTSRGFSTLFGDLIIRLTNPASISDVENIDNAIDQDTATYSEIPETEVFALAPIGSASTSDVGYLSLTDANVAVTFGLSTDGGGDRDYTIDYYNNTLNVPAGDTTPTTGTLTLGTVARKTHPFGEDTNGKQDSSVMPWSIEEITTLEYSVKNTEAGAGDSIYVYYAYLDLVGIKVYHINNARKIRQETPGGRNL